jgi:hypothetical protein
VSQLALPFISRVRDVPTPPAPPAPPREAADAASGKESATRLALAIRDATNRAVALHVTDNKRVLISQKREGDRLVVRLHHVFLRAEPAVVAAVARYVHRRDPKAGALIDAFLSREHDYLRRSRARRETTARPVGSVHDLDAILDEVASTHFDEPLALPRITWGKRSGARRKRRSIQLGTYEREEALIRIHPALDRDWVPRSYVGFIVYHELLHHVIPPVERAGRLHVHTAEFRKLERRYANFDEARRFEKENLNRLLAER